MTRQERARVMAMYGAIGGLHALGFFIFVFVLPSHYEGLGIGVSVLAYTLGLRHAFDADHISAIDNSTRKVLGERQGTGKPRPFGFGFFFSLGHSTIVVAIGVGIIVAEKTVFTAVSNSSSGLEQFGGLFGTVVSASFLFLIGLLNLVILAGIVRVFASMRRGTYDEAELERQLASRGLFYRFFGRWMRAITKEWQMYPVGVVFGLGFDAATEIALLATTALLASQHIPWYAIVCLPILFTAGMTVMDTTDGLFMNLAYGWAFFNPRPEGVLQPGHHRAVRGDLLLHRRHRGPQPAPAGDRRAQPDHRLLGPDVQLQPQHGRVRHRGHVPPHLAGRAAHLAVRPDRGTMDRQSAARPGGERPTLTTQGPEQGAAITAPHHPRSQSSAMGEPPSGVAIGADRQGPPGGIQPPRSPSSRATWAATLTIGLRYTGGSVRGYRAIFVPSTALASPGYDGQPAVYLYIAALEVNVLNCRGEGRALAGRARRPGRAARPDRRRRRGRRPAAGRAVD